MSADQQSGALVGDDERCAVTFGLIHPAIHAILLCICIKSGATSFENIKGVYVRLLDCQSSHRELELFRVSLPEAVIKGNRNRTAVMGSLERTSDGRWHFRTVAQTVAPADPVRRLIPEGDVVVAIQHGQIEMRQRDLVQDGFAVNVKRIRDAPRPVTLTFQHPDVPETGFVVREPGLPSPGERYDVVFEGDPTNCLQFRAGPGQAPVVQSVASVSPIVPHNTLLFPFLSQEMQNHSRNRPRSVVISNIRAYIPACDKGGTTDAYALVYTKNLNVDNLKKRYTKQPVLKTKILKKTKAPAWVEWPEASVKLNLVRTNSLLPEVLAVLDQDALSKDDKIFSHRINLSWCLYNGDEESYTLQPTKVRSIESMPANSGFTSGMVVLKYTLRFE